MGKFEAKQNGTKVVTGMVRLSYANLFEPRAANEGQVPKYSVSLIIPKSDTATIKAIQAATEEAKKRDKGKWDGKVPARLKTPLRDGDEDRPDDEAYADSYFVNANSTTKAPQVVDRYGKSLGSEDVYSGCYARVSLNFYGYNEAGSKGIACGLGNVQKLEDGERLGGGFSTAEDDFDFDDDDFLS